MTMHRTKRAWITPLCRLLGIRLPVVQAPIGSAASPELVAAVSNAGGLGMLPLTWSSPDATGEAIRRTKDLTDQPFGANLALDFPVAAQLDVALESGVTIISTFWGDPSEVHERVASAGAQHLHTVASPHEARAAVTAGADVIVAQGWEAGGHVWGEVASLPLVPAVVDAVAPVPVIAAGGIADGRGLAAVLMLGAQAAWMGTRFLTATEASTHESYRTRIVEAGPTDTVYTTCFDGGWPNAPHRVLRNSTLDSWEAAGRPEKPGRPGEGDVVAQDNRGYRVRRYDDTPPAGELSGDLEAMALYAGQSAGLVNEVTTASTIITQILDEADTALAHWQRDAGDGVR